MRPLKELLHAIPVTDYHGDLDAVVLSLCFDSRKVEPGSAFVAIRGYQTDGHRFVHQAVKQGARAIIVEEFPDDLSAEVTYIRVADTAYVLGVMASNYYGNPSQKLKLVGVTGTNGKTTVVTLLFNLFHQMGHRVGLLSTVRNQIDARVVEATHTTPDPISLNALLKEMVDAGCGFCFMEVSSHAVAQQRIAGLHFTGGVFTNITQDHLDYHGSFPAYIKAKKKFFDDLDRAAFALTNVDDKNGQVMLQNSFAHRKTYGLHQMADFHAKILENHFDGMLLSIDAQEVWVKLVGNFNAYNLLAVYGTAILLEQETMRILTALSEVSGASGRFETLKSPNNVVVIVDYAHTPDAVANVLKTIGSLRKNQQQILTVLGCGGDRDKGKRPDMAAVASELSDKLVLTSDNPRSEDPGQIIKDMEAGISDDRKKNAFSITDRREAIRAAMHLAQPGDIVLVAGKGHETYQEIKGVRHHFDDKEELIKIFNEQN